MVVVPYARFGFWESFGTSFNCLRLIWGSRTASTGCRRSRRTLGSNLASKHDRDLFFLNRVFLGTGNHLGQCQVASNWPEGHEQPVRAVGGQVEVHGVTWLPSMLTKLVWYKKKTHWKVDNLVIVIKYSTNTINFWLAVDYYFMHGRESYNH